MEPTDIVFDEDLTCYVELDAFTDQIGIVLSDELDASEEDLSDNYKRKIINFIKASSNWYPKAIENVIGWGRKEYNFESNENDIQLLSIYILFEQSEDELYGLEFRVEFDVEHGCGLKIGGRKLDIFEIGEGEVAFG